MFVVALRKQMLTLLVPGTLLNRLFGSNFDVMDETKRQQTTKGQFLLSRQPLTESN